METLTNKVEDISWKIIQQYFLDNPTSFVQHHLDSYNDLFANGIQQIFKEKNPIQIRKNHDETLNDYKFQCNLYLGGKQGDSIHYGKPVIYDDNHMHYMYPNEARLRNMTYGFTVHYDVDIEIVIIRGNIDKLEKEVEVVRLEKILLGRFPIMLQSKLCILNELHRELRFQMGECKNDYGGYFIIDGKEKLIVPQEKFADNMVYIKENDKTSLYSHSAIIRMVSEDASKPVRTLKMHYTRPKNIAIEAFKFSCVEFKNIVVDIPNVRKPVPLFILMRALGIISDKKIVETILLDLEKHKNLIDLLIPSIHDANVLFTQDSALKYIATFTKGKTMAHAYEILMNYLFPQIGELNFIQKAHFLGYMCLSLLEVVSNITPPTDRDSFKYKRVELAGTLLYDLFKEYYTLQQRNIFLKVEKELYYHYNNRIELGDIKMDEMKAIFIENSQEYFKERIVETGFRKAFKGNWGASSHTKILGVVQDLNRLSYNSYLSHLRKLNLPFDASAKVIGPRLLHNSQWGYIDPIDTPDGGNVGLHKHMAIMCSITNGYSSKQIISWLRNKMHMKFIEECYTEYLSTQTKVFINGSWIGVLESLYDTVQYLRQCRRLSLIPIYTSISYSVHKNEIYVFTDSGRLIRPIYYIDHEGVSIQSRVKELVEDGPLSWKELVHGKLIFDVDGYNRSSTVTIDDDILQDEKKFDEHYKANKALLDFIDTSETESLLISNNIEQLKPDEHKRVKPYSNLEIHPSLLFGVMGNQVIFPENNPPTRNLFSCGQSKQSCSLYHSNYHNRMDKTGIVLNYGQSPLIKSRYMEFMHRGEHPYGVNTIVAIMSYGGYNVEDAILVNEGAIRRGLFHTTYYSTYESRETSSSVQGDSDSYFMNIRKEDVVYSLKMGLDYEQLDDRGLAKEGTIVSEKTIVIGKATVEEDRGFVDDSIKPKKGQLGVVDRSFITDDEQGFRIAKVRIRDERVPAIGDKMASRAGQKGTIGLIIPEENMPFTSDGIRPDLIINPHAIPSRMTIGQLVECLVGKASAHYGSYGDCTAFTSGEDTRDIYGSMLNKMGYHSEGNEILYNGETGEQLSSEIFMGPTYYMRLKHMVKDKINYRARGPRLELTRQAVHGRANDGGLRIGEMERDGVIAHGASKFLQESMLERGDKYYMAICNKTGMIAAYNASQNIFYSPFADGPIKFHGDTDKMRIQHISQFGRSFSIVRVPYSFKLLIHELQTMNIQMKIITEDNVDQLSSMVFSNNYKALAFDDMKTLQSHMITLREKLYASDRTIKARNETIVEEKDKSPGFAPSISDETSPSEAVNSEMVVDNANGEPSVQSANPNVSGASPAIATVGTDGQQPEQKETQSNPLVENLATGTTALSGALETFSSAVSDVGASINSAFVNTQTSKDSDNIPTVDSVPTAPRVSLVEPEVEKGSESKNNEDDDSIDDESKQGGSGEGLFKIKKTITLG